jgi:protein arginine kinase
MTILDPTKGTGEWLRGTGRLSDVVVSSRIRLARNLSDYPFLSTASETERKEIHRCFAEALADSPLARDSVLIDLEQTEPIDREILVERHLISRQHLAAQGSRGVSVSHDETRAVMINEEDHVRLQALRSGLELEAAWEEVNRIDDMLGKRVSFAFDKQLGFLTACPTNVGTGIRVSVMLHLPALKLTKEIERVARAARDMHLAVRGAFGEGTDVVGDMYQLSNQTTLGRSETEIVEAFSRKIVPKIAEYEHTARETLAKHRPHHLDDRIWRAFGILANARHIGSEEAQALLSPLRMGIHMKRFTSLDVATLNELFLFTQPAHLQKIVGRPLEDDDRDIVRAEYLRKRLAGIRPAS